MQKNYRDYTVGELLDMGLSVEVFNHNDPSEEEAKQLMSQIEGIKQSSHQLKGGLNVIKGWRKGFHITNFLEGGE